MHSFTRSIVLIVFAAVAGSGFAQDDSTRIAGGMFHIARPAEVMEDPVSAEAEAEDLVALRLHPINLNAVTAEQLLVIPFISPVLARRIVERRDSIGAFQSVKDLFAIDGIDKRVVAFIMPYVTCTDSTVMGEARSRVSATLERQAGYVDGAYAGDKLHDFQRLDVRSHEWEGCVVTEKDPGESSYVDHLATSLSYHAKSLQVIVGDYTVGRGQGLLYWRGLSTGKTSEVIRAPRRTSLGIVPARSATESGNFFGGGAAWSDGAWNSGLFCSDTHRDASIGSDGSFTTLATSGLHRTTSELAALNTIRERALGGHLGWEGKDASLEMIASYTDFNHLWRHEGAAVNTILNAGINGHLSFSNADLFGEYATDAQGGAALVAGGLAHLGDEFDCAALYRRYPRRFLAIHANAFGEHTTAENEEGIYLGARWDAGDVLSISAFHDVFAFPFPSATLPIATNGDESLLVIDVACASNINVRLLGSWKRTPVASNDTSAFGDIESQIQLSLRRRARFELTYEKSTLRLRGRAELTNYRSTVGKPVSAGILILTDIGIKPWSGTSISARLTWFSTASYDARVYENEEGLDGLAEVPSLDGGGNRMYLLMSSRLTDTFTLEAKWSATYKPTATSMGSGEDRVDGNFVQVVEVQGRVRF